MAGFSSPDEIYIRVTKDDPEAFYARIPYDMLPRIHRIGGKWMQSGKEWRFPMDDEIWEKFQKEFDDFFKAGKVKKDLGFILAFDKRRSDLKKFLSFKEVAMKDEPTDFGVEGVGLDGKNCLFNYQRWGVKCGLSVGDGFLIGDVPGLGKCLGMNNLCNFSKGIAKVSSVLENLDDGWYASDDGVGEWHDLDGSMKILGRKDGKDQYFPIRRVYREKVERTGILQTQSGLSNEFGCNHRFFTNMGWKSLSELTEEDWILCGETIAPSTESVLHFDPEDIYWLAFQIAEGCDSGSSPTHTICNCDVSMLERIKRHLDGFGLCVDEGGRRFIVSISSADRGGNRQRLYTLHFNYRFSNHLVDTFGYKLNTKSGTKEIPVSILNADDDNVRLFVRTMWDCEGCCSNDNLEFSSKSYDVVEKMWYLMKRFGVFGVVSNKKVRISSGVERYWRINVGGIYARKFQQEFGFSMDYKIRALEKLCQRNCNTNIGYSSPCRHLMKRLIYDVLETSCRILDVNKEKLERKNQFGVDVIRNFYDIAMERTSLGVYRKKSKWSELEDNFNRNRLAKKSEVNAILNEIYSDYCGSVQWLKVKSVHFREKRTFVYDFEVEDESHNYYASGMLTHNTIQAIGIVKERMNRGEVRNCLIVCPASLKYNWKAEIERFTNEKALVIGHKCKNQSERERHWIAEGFSFKITNYEMVAKDLYCEPKKEDHRISSWKYVLNSFDAVVFDECHMLKHHSSQRTQACRLINAKYRIGLSGTPIDGRLEEIHSIFQILKPGLFVSKQKFMERYAEYDYFGAVKGYHHVQEVSDKIAPYYLRRLKEEVAKDLPPKLYKDMYVELSDKNMKAYKDLVKKKNEITTDASAMELVLRARQFLDFPEILGLHNTSDKYKVFKDLIDELVRENDQKVLVFSQFTESIKWLIKNLEGEYKGIRVIDGSVGSEERLNICNDFNSDPNFHILICSDAANFGLNLGKADAVINFNSSFQPSVNLQREDRAHRISNDRNHNVTIYRFICRDTVEEHVMDILARKQAVNNALLGEKNDSFERGNLSAMEILSCL